MNMKVLLIDDDEGVRSSLSLLLKSEGFLVACYNGSRGIDKLLPAIKPDVILTDHNLNKGEEKGLHLAERLQKEGRRVVLMSSDLTLREEASSKGVPFFFKLGEYDDLFRLLREAV